MKFLSISLLILFTLSISSLQAKHDPEKKPDVIVENHSGYAAVVVYRPWKYPAMLAPIHLHVDEDVKLSLWTNAKDTLYLAPGTYRLKRKFGDSWPEEIRVEAGQIYFVKLYANLLGKQLEVIDPYNANQELSLNTFHKRGKLRVKPVSRVRLN